MGTLLLLLTPVSCLTTLYNVLVSFLSAAACAWLHWLSIQSFFSCWNFFNILVQLAICIILCVLSCSCACLISPVFASFLLSMNFQVLSDIHCSQLVPCLRPNTVSALLITLELNDSNCPSIDKSGCSISNRFASSSRNPSAVVGSFNFFTV